ncbi:MAG: NAD(P)H-dependent glycerol-3-phosphate dehydrogenase [Bacillota bacterium]|nr:NAD(P)H-dependent glycerol-3-phosphate dehydrogenase [Bacillota bacterium]
MDKKISVIGCGRWGTFIGWYLHRIGLKVTIYGRSGSRNMAELQENRANKYLELPDDIILTNDLQKATAAENIIISVNAQGLRQLMAELRPLELKNKAFILCMKGVEISTGNRLTEVVAETSDPSNRAAVWLGPGHVQEFIRGVPNCMVIDSADNELKHSLVQAFSGDLIRFYYGNDLLGNEIGAAAKNVMGIAAGMLDGMGVSSLKGALMSRGTREVARLIKAMGGNELSAYGLCHLGDYEATVFSRFSHNRSFGEAYVKGEEFSSLAEGFYTVKALKKLGERYKADLPICNGVYAILYEKQEAEATLRSLFFRSLKQEF